jgi:bifunctional DNA-binding transcriptional regulator/antitoxin component of YhaV-PrlF toxin-antitoxin module
MIEFPCMKGILTTLTERGQVSMPASLRKLLHLKVGQPLMWEKVSDTECRVRIVRPLEARAAKSMRGFMKRFQAGSKLPATTTGWMKLLREGERA